MDISFWIEDFPKTEAATVANVLVEQFIDLNIEHPRQLRPSDVLKTTPNIRTYQARGYDLRHLEEVLHGVLPVSQHIGK